MERKKRMNIITLDVSHMHGQLKNHIFPNKGKLRPRYYAKSPPAQDVFRTIPGLISCTRVTREMWTAISCTEYSQVAGLIHTTGRKSLNVASVHAVALQKSLI